MGKRLTIAMTAFVLLAVLLGTYVAGYFWLGERVDAEWNGRIVATSRCYRHQWMASVFKSAAEVESRLTDIRVETGTYEPYDP